MAIKTAILLLVAWLLYGKLSNHQNLQTFRTLLQGLDRNMMLLTLSAVLVMMLLNWFLEALKWKFLCAGVSPIGTWRAVESVFCGLTWAVFTPNRIGEYGGRVMFLPSRRRIQGAVAMGVGALAQVTITNVLGAASLCWFAGRYLDVNGWPYAVLWVAGALYIVGFLFLYFNVRLVYNGLLRVRFLKKFHRFFEILCRYRQADLRRVFAFSLSRFAVYTSQYILLMQVIIPGLPFVPMLLMIFILFFVQTVLPTLDLFDFGVRSLTAGYFFSFITPQEVAVMASASCIWFVNLILPAILGSVFVLKINFFGTPSTTDH